MTDLLETKPCQLCGMSTTYSRLCNACWEVERNFTDQWHLRLSPLACAVADEWQDWKNRNGDSPAFTGKGEGALNALEAATRESEWRRVKPTGTSASTPSEPPADTPTR